MRALFTPLLPDDYLELINPLWSTQELRGRIERIERETADAVTVVIKPGLGVGGPQARPVPARSASSSTACTTGAPTRSPPIPGAPTAASASRPSCWRPARSRRTWCARPSRATIVRLGGVEGDLRAARPAAREGCCSSAPAAAITPIMSMLRSLDRAAALRDVVHLHSARTEDDVIFGEQLRRLDERHAGYRLDVRLTGEQGRLAPGDLDELCPDWREREAFVCGPAEMLDALTEHWEQQRRRLRPPAHGALPARHRRGRRRARRGRHDPLPRESASRPTSDGDTPILVAGEEAGATLPFGCRMGICHTCVGRLCSGRIRDLRTGEVARLGGRDGPHLHQRARRAGRDRTLTTTEDPWPP